MSKDLKSKYAQIVEDEKLRGNLRDILKEFPDVMNAQVDVSTSREKLVDDLVALIQRIPLDETMLNRLYHAVTARMRSKTCNKCLKVKPEVGGLLMHIDGDLSRPKRWVCAECKRR